MLKQLRTTRNLTRRELATKVGVSVSYIKLMEIGDRRKPAIEVIAKIAAELSLSDDERLRLYDSFGSETPLAAIAGDPA